jgi:hypothetical protein
MKSSSFHLPGGGVSGAWYYPAISPLGRPLQLAARAISHGLCKRAVMIGREPQTYAPRDSYARVLLKSDNNVWAVPAVLENTSTAVTQNSA